MNLPPASLVVAAILAASPAWSQQASSQSALPEAEAPATAPWPLATVRARDSALPWARIEQIRRGNRIVEVKVTDAAGDTRYTMINREGQPPRSTQELSSGLSTPRFFTFDF